VVTFALSGSFLFLLTAVLYGVLAAGKPYGALVAGVKAAVLPKALRPLCVIILFLQLTGMVVLLQTAGIVPLIFSEKATHIICCAFGAYSFISTIPNLFSCKPEQGHIATLLSLITALCCIVTALGASGALPNLL